MKKSDYLLENVFCFRIREFCNQRHLKNIQTIRTLPCWMFVFYSIYESRLASWTGFKDNPLQFHYFNTDFYNNVLSYKSFRYGISQ